jgi:hypothetical protein
LKGYFLGLKHPLNIGFTLMAALVAWFYGWALAGIINKAYLGDMGSFKPQTIINYSLVAIVGFVLLRMIFPRYKPQRQYLPKFYPLSRFQHYLLSVVSDLTKPLIIGIAMFVSICSLYLYDSKITFLVLGLSALITAQLLRRLVQYGIDYRKNSLGNALFAMAWVIPVLLSANYTFLFQYILIVSLLLPFYLFAIGYLLELTILENRKSQMAGGTKSSNLYLKLLINNPKARLILLFGIGFKSFLLIADFYMFRSKGKHMFDGQLVYWMFASPLLLFTYVFNNVWGFWKAIWFNYELRTGSYKEMTHFVARLLVLPILIDVLITLPLLLLTWDQTRFILLFYVVSLLFLIAFSFLWSLLFPMSVITSFQMRGNSSFVSSMVSMVAVVFLSLLKLNNWFYILIPFYLFLSYMAYHYSQELYRLKKYNLYNKLQKG